MRTKEFQKDKASFLIVENHPLKRNTMIEMLTNLGFSHFDHASDGAAAFHTLKRRPVDCIISCMDMPQMNGIALLKVVSSDDVLFRIPFILMTHSITKEMVLEAGQCGVADILIEPITQSMLEQKINNLVDGGVHDAKTEKIDDLFEQAKGLTDNESYEDALSVYKKIMEVYEDAEIYYNIGYIKTSQGKYDEAIVAFRKAVMINNLHARAYKMMGEVYTKKGDAVEAEKCFEKAGEIFLERNMDKEAEEAFKAVLKINPDTVNVYNSLGIIYRKQHNYKEAVHQYETALKVDPEDENIYFNLGRALLEDKQIKEARKVFEKALVINPELTEAKRMLQAIEVGFK